MDREHRMVNVTNFIIVFMNSQNTWKMLASGMDKDPMISNLSAGSRFADEQTRRMSKKKFQRV